MNITIGRIVIYTLTEADAFEINRRRDDASRSKAAASALGFTVHVGNQVRAGEEYPMVVTRVWEGSPPIHVNGQVLLDGNDLYWATSVANGPGARQWRWPERVAE